MAVRFFSNKGKNFKNANYLSLAPANRFTVYATVAADVAIVDMFSFLSPGNVLTVFQHGISAGTLKIELSLSEKEVILKDQTAAAWHELAAALASTAYQSTNLVFAWARLTFSQPAKAYIAAL